MKDEEVVEVDAVRVRIHETHQSTETGKCSLVIAGFHESFGVCRNRLNALKLRVVYERLYTHIHNRAVVFGEGELKG